VGSRDAIHEAIKRSFKALDEEILDQAKKSDIKECQYGGTTALMTLCIGRVFFHVLRIVSDALMTLCIGRCHTSAFMSTRLSPARRIWWHL
jgi:hypothetical protein